MVRDGVGEVGLGREPLRLLSDELSKATAGPAPPPVELGGPSRPGDTDL